MLQAQDSRIASMFKQKVMTITPVKRMVVFGSRARGDAVKESDLDIFIGVPMLTPGLRQQIYEIAWEIGFENEMVISTLLTSTPLLIDGPLTGNPILHAIESDGVLI